MVAAELDVEMDVRNKCEDDKGGCCYRCAPVAFTAVITGIDPVAPARMTGESAAIMMSSWFVWREDEAVG